MLSRVYGYYGHEDIWEVYFCRNRVGFIFDSDMIASDIKENNKMGFAEKYNAETRRFSGNEFFFNEQPQLDQYIATRYLRFACQ